LAYSFEANGKAYLRIEGELLYESQRRQFDYRFVDRKLVCARDECTNLNTIGERSGDNPEGRPPFWHVELRVYDGAKLVHTSQDQAGADPPAVGEDEVQNLAKILLAAKAAAK
jgi:hypothetical protein